MSTRRRPPKPLLLLVVLLLVGSTACGGDDTTAEDGGEETASPAAEAPSTVSVELQEWAVAPDPDSAVAGDVTFEVENIGEDEHEFVIVATDLEAGNLPTKEDGSVDEEGEGIEIVDEVESLEPGDTGEVTADLEAGSYVLICNLVDEETTDGETEVEVHYQLGMRTGFTVE